MILSGQTKFGRRGICLVKLLLDLSENGLLYRFQMALC